MAPEVFAAGAHVGVKADVYALGCLLLECITGTRPWDGLNAMQVTFQVRAVQTGARWWWWRRRRAHRLGICKWCMHSAGGTAATPAAISAGRSGGECATHRLPLPHTYVCGM